MAKIKATHLGECQCCGATQKLPNNLLAKHGYTVANRGQWGWFSGTCQGSDQLPLEVSKDLVELFIQQTLDRRAKLIEFINQLRQPATEPKAWFHDYLPSRGMVRGGYIWRQVAITTVDGRLSLTRYGHNGNDIVQDAYRCGVGYGHSFETELELASHMNAIYADRLEKGEIAQMDHYIAWQRERITNWKPKALKELSK